MENGERRIICDDYMGKIDMINSELFLMLLKVGFLFVIVLVFVREKGEELNV